MLSINLIPVFQQAIYCNVFYSAGETEMESEVFEFHPNMDVFNYSDLLYEDVIEAIKTGALKKFLSSESSFFNFSCMSNLTVEQEKLLEIAELIASVVVDTSVVNNLNISFSWGWRLESKDQAIHLPWHVGYQSLEEAKAACRNQLLFNK